MTVKIVNFKSFKFLKTNFLQRLAHSNDIQNAIFYRSTIGKPPSLNKEAQSEFAQLNSVNPHQFKNQLNKQLQLI